MLTENGLQLNKLIFQSDNTNVKRITVTELNIRTVGGTAPRVTWLRPAICHPACCPGMQRLKYTKP
jgi:hypothetical protein